MEAEDLVELEHQVGRADPSLAPIRSVDTDLICSACALESRRRPVPPAGKKTRNGNTRSTFEVIGTTVTTPRPSRAAAAPSLETSTAGRRGKVSTGAPRDGRRDRDCSRADGGVVLGDRVLTERILEAHRWSRGANEAPRIPAGFRVGAVRVDPKQVARLMHQAGIEGGSSIER